MIFVVPKKVGNESGFNLGAENGTKWRRKLPTKWYTQYPSALVLKPDSARSKIPSVSTQTITEQVVDNVDHWPTSFERHHHNERTAFCIVGSYVDRFGQCRRSRRDPQRKLWRIDQGKELVYQICKTPERSDNVLLGWVNWWKTQWLSLECDGSLLSELLTRFLTRISVLSCFLLNFFRLDAQLAPW